LTSSVRAFEAPDLDRVVELSLAAWAPIFTSFRRVLGDTLYYLAYPDWQESQSRAVRAICSSQETKAWVAVLDDRPVGFVASQIKLASDPLAGEIEMIADDPKNQRSEIATRLLEHAINHLHTDDMSLVEIATGGDPAHTPPVSSMKRRLPPAAADALLPPLAS
jgi:ribosomal protein S18 acetylase RimI-like enzyme